MMNINVVLVFLFTFSWITKSDFEFHSVLVQPGEDVTLLCPNFTNVVEHIFWYKLMDGPNVSSISSIIDPGSEARLHNEFQREKFDMTSNITNIFLNIKQVNFSDSGVYICGTMSPSCQKIFSETYLQVEDGLDGFIKLLTVTLGGLVILLAAVIVGLVWKIRTFHNAQTNKQHRQQNENLDSNSENYAALKFRPKANSNTQLSERTKITQKSEIIYEVIVEIKSISLTK
uniref:Ig-like domain-containing protein n=1 Tax=Poecilia formosa TaxID=48698 RepID=A0A096LTT3_POEFO